MRAGRGTRGRFENALPTSKTRKRLGKLGGRETTFRVWQRTKGQVMRGDDRRGVSRRRLTKVRTKGTTVRFNARLIQSSDERSSRSRGLFTNTLVGPSFETRFDRMLKRERNSRSRRQSPAPLYRERETRRGLGGLSPQHSRSWRYFVTLQSWPTRTANVPFR